MLKKVQQSNWESEQSLRKSIYLDATRFCKSGKMLFIYLFNSFFDTTRREYVVGSFKVSTTFFCCCFFVDELKLRTVT